MLHLGVNHRSTGESEIAGYPTPEATFPPEPRAPSEARAPAYPSCQGRIIRASHGPATLALEMESMFSAWFPWVVLAALALWALMFRPERDSLNS